MNKKKQRIKIAEFCGTLVNKGFVYDANDQSSYGCPPEEIIECPNYPEDLNAMHEALKFIGEIKGIDLCWHLNDMGISGEWEILTATAEELAEAFLKTLNLWEE